MIGNNVSKKGCEKMSNITNEKRLVPFAYEEYEKIYRISKQLKEIKSITNDKDFSPENVDFNDKEKQKAYEEKYNYLKDLEIEFLKALYNNFWAGVNNARKYTKEAREANNEEEKLPFE